MAKFLVFVVVIYYDYHYHNHFSLLSLHVYKILLIIYFITVALARNLYKLYPRAREVDRCTPYNDRRKMGHFSWIATDMFDKEQVIVNVYAVHKVRNRGKTRPKI